ncbi:MAG: DNA translocase FtsK [Bacteroidales bacterium]|nr:DNA translocase FtsK [Bacteroidales bacterium]
MKPNSPIDLSLDGFGTAPEPRVTKTDTATADIPRERQTKSATQRRKVTPSQQPVKPRKKPQQESKYNPVIEFFRSPRTRHTLGVILTVLSVVMLIVTFNYLKNGAADQSLVAGRSISEIANSGQTVETAGGPAGSKLAHLLLVDGLGLGSLVMVVYTGVLGLSLFGLMRCRFWAFTFRCLFTAISLSIILGLFTYNFESTINWGGNHGHYVNQWMYHVSDAVGAYALSVMLIGLLTVMYINQIRLFCINVSGGVAKARQAMAAAAAEGRKISTELADVPETSNAMAVPVTEPTEAPASAVSAPVADTEKTLPDEMIGFSIDDIDELPATTTANFDSRPADKPVVVDKAEKEAAPSEPEFNVITAKPETVEPKEKTVESVLAQDPLNIRDELSHYKFPDIDLLIDRPVDNLVNADELQENKDLIVKTLSDYKIPISKIEATIGPTVTRYEIVPAEGVRIAQIKRLEDDIALQLAALGIRIIAPIPGKGTVGIEVPNRTPQTVSMYTVLNSRKYRECKMALPMALGSTINNDIFIEDLARMPHLLVAGATGQGKSVGLNCIIASLLYKKHPGELKFVLIDPKMVEFSLYSRIEHHYLAKLPDEEDAIVTEPSKALTTLQSLCVEMDNRYELLKAASVRTVDEYNSKFTRHMLNPEKGHKYMPYIVMVVDEFADLIMTAGKEISNYIARIAQKARAVGMHMIIATQRPSTDVITGMIKANFPGRIAFRVASMVDSKTILDCPGANRLIGRGDMLFSHNGKMERVQCAFIDTPEVAAIVDFIDRQTGYPTAYLLPEPQNENAIVPGAIDLSKRDEKFDDCARFVVQNSTASTSSLQRRFEIGYNKAGKIMDQLEAAGIVGPADGQKPRAVLVDAMALEDLLRSL